MTLRNAAGAFAHPAQFFNFGRDSVSRKPAWDAESVFFRFVWVKIIRIRRRRFYSGDRLSPCADRNAAFGQEGADDSTVFSVPIGIKVSF
jgi:hypothetical protein